MNQFDIEAELDKRLNETELLLEKRLRAAQKTILAQLAAMYAKYERDGALTYQEMQKYNRLDKELKRITDTLTAEYQQVVTQVQEMQENHYLLKFLLTAYLLDQFISRPSLPSTEVIGASFIFIAGGLKIPRLPKRQENDVINSLEFALSKSVSKRETKKELISRIENALPSTMREVSGLVDQLADSLTERLEANVNAINIKIPNISEVRQEIKIDGLTLSHFLTVKRNRIAAKINEQIGIALRKNETVHQMSKRIKEIMGPEINSLRLFLRNASDRVRAVALGSVENQIANISDVRGVWLSKRDGIVRPAHKKLDGERTDRRGYFHYKGMKAKAPRMWGEPGMDNYCRCKKLTLVDFKVPVVEKGVEYNNREYQRQLEVLAKKKVEELSLTFEKAYAQALNEIPPPWGDMPFVPYSEWLTIMGVKGDLSGVAMTDTIAESYVRAGKEDRYASQRNKRK